MSIPEKYHLCINCKKAEWYSDYKEYICEANGCTIGRTIDDLSEEGCSADFDPKSQLFLKEELK